jgi:hypothetical protein
MNYFDVNEWEQFSYNGINFLQNERYQMYKRIEPCTVEDEDKMIPLYLRDDIHQRDLEIWMAENIKGFWWYFDDAIVYMTDQEDAMLVKLTWG